MAFLDRFKDAKTRSLLVFGVIILLFISTLVYFIVKKPDPVATDESRATKLPEITAIPGGVTSERYQELLVEENRKRAEAAKKAGTSAVATIIGARKREGTDTFGIEGLLKSGECKCSQAADTPNIPDLDPIRAAQLLSELTANPDNALQLLKQNPGLGKALCKQNPALALQLMEKDNEIAKIILTECPELAQKLAEQNPELFKKLMLANPDSAKKLAQQNPALFKKLMAADPQFARQFANGNPEAMKALMQAADTPNIPDLDPIRAAQLLSELTANPDNALQLLKQNPGLGKALCKQNPTLALQLMEKDNEIAKIILTECPELAQKLAEQNPELFKKLMLINPDLAKKIAQQNPALLKKLMTADPQFARQFANGNPEAMKALMQNDSTFANTMLAQNPDVVKNLMTADPQFAAALMHNNAGAVKDLMLQDPEFAKSLANTNSAAVKDLLLKDPDFAKNILTTHSEFAKALVASNPAAMKELFLKNPELAKAIAKTDPSLLADLVQDDPLFAKNLEQKNPGITAGLPKGTRISTLNAADQERARAAAIARRKQFETQNAQQKQLKLNEQQQRQVQTLISNMEGQSKAIFQAWNEYTPQQYVQGQFEAKKESLAQGSDISGTNQPSSTPNAGSNQSSNILFKAGTILFAVLDTTINSDEPGPVMATIIDGKYRGAKLLGTMASSAQPGGQPPEKVTLSFNLMSTPEFPTSLSVQAVGIDPDTARTALASDVDHHYLLRYGTMFAAAFMSGYSKVITSQGTVQTTSTNGLSSTTTAPQLSGKKELFAALGEVGKKWGDTVSKLANMPPTITVDAGQGIGILFLTDVNG